MGGALAPLILYVNTAIQPIALHNPNASGNAVAIAPGKAARTIDGALFWEGKGGDNAGGL
jgi:hypothetical protein